MGGNASERMHRNTFFIAALPLAAVSIAALVYFNVHHGSTPDWEGTGHQLMVEHRVVNASMTFQRNLRRSDALSVVLTLNPAPTKGDTSALADESAGTLEPVLTMTDCTSTALTSPMAKPTKYLIASFVWFWTVSDCTNAGNKQLHLLLKYAGSSRTGDPIAYQTNAHVNVTDSFTLEDWLKIVGAISGLLTAVSVVLGVVMKRKAATA